MSFKWCVVLILAFSTIKANSQLLRKIFPEKVKIYGITFKSTDVVGVKSFGNNTDFYKTRIGDGFIEKESHDFYYMLGSYRNSLQDWQPHDLFNLSMQDASFPLMDVIDDDYYRSYGFQIVETRHPEMLQDQAYLNLKLYYSDTSKVSVAARKNMLSKASPIIKNAILQSRFELVRNRIKVNKKKVSKTTAELKASLDTITINANAKVSADIRAYISRLADQAVNVEGYLITATLRDPYKEKIRFHIENIKTIFLGADQFAKNLESYLEADDAAVTSGLVAIQVAGGYDKTKISVDSVTAGLRGNFDIPQADAVKIAASVSYAFTRDEKVTFETKFDKLFVIKFTTAKMFDFEDVTRIRSKMKEGYEVGNVMGQVSRQIQEYYKVKNAYPESLSQLNIAYLLSSLGDRVKYTYIAANDVRLSFAGLDGILDTRDDRVHEGKNGIFKTIN